MAKRRKPAGMSSAAQESRESVRTYSSCGRIIDPDDVPLLNSRTGMTEGDIRRLCEFDPVLALQWYFPYTLGLSPFSAAHVTAIDRNHLILKRGGRALSCFFRGAAKTTMTEAQALLAALDGYQRYILILASTQKNADDIIESIKMELSTNDRLLAAYPEACQPIVALEGRAQRGHTQVYIDEDGEKMLTRVMFNAEMVRLPAVRGAKCSGAIIKARGLTSNGLRGLSAKLPDGTKQRVTFVMGDDLQTDESAKSETQCNNRWDLLNRTVFRLGGHREQLSVCINGTPIVQNDLIDRLLNAPSFSGYKVPFFQSMPKDESDPSLAFWVGPYAEARHAVDDHDPESIKAAHQAATELYRQNRELADRGFVATWQSCFDPRTEISAIQHGMNIYVDDSAESFAAEMQMNPSSKLVIGDLEIPSREVLETHWGSTVRGETLPGGHVTTAFMDVQKAMLFWGVMSFSPGFDSVLLDYGSYPEVDRADFDYKADILQKGNGFRGDSVEHAITEALEALTSDLFARYTIDVAAIDASYETETVNSFCRSSVFPLYPCQGQGILATQKPMSQWSSKSGKRLIGKEWNIEAHQLRFDANYWKTFLVQRLDAKGSGACRFYRHRRHVMLARHCHGEWAQRVSAGSRTIHQWRPRPGSPDNHLLDVLVGCHVLASVRGVDLASRKPAKQSPKRAVRRAKFATL